MSTFPCVLVIFIGLNIVLRGQCVRVMEEVPIGTLITIVPNNSTEQATFSISEGKYQNYFRIDASSGRLFTDKILDREVICPNISECSIPLKINRTVNETSEIINIPITIDDVNDNAPIFDEGFVSKIIKENAPVGTYIILSEKEATDLDVGRNSDLSYTIIGASSTFNITLDDLGIRLGLKIPLDYEDIPTYTLKIIAADNGFPPRSGTLLAQINVIDVNDNNPIFPEANVTMEVIENTPLGSHIPLTTPGATDKDSGINGHLSYFLRGESTFQLGYDTIDNKQVNFSLILNRTLDYETRAVYNLQLIVVDGAVKRLSGTLQINIIVIDINDNVPKLSLSSNSATISKSVEVNSSIMHMSATDNDSGLNGEVLYYLVPSQDPLIFQLFYIDHRTGIMKVRENLENITTKTFHVQVEARDNGAPSLKTDPLTIHIFVQDMPSTETTPTIQPPSTPEREGDKKLWLALVIVAVLMLLLFLFIYILWRARHRLLRTNNCNGNNQAKSVPEIQHVQNSIIYDEVDKGKTKTTHDSEIIPEVMTDDNKHIESKVPDQNIDINTYTDMRTSDKTDSDEYTKMYSNINVTNNTETVLNENITGQTKQEALAEDHTTMNDPQTPHVYSNINSIILPRGESVEDNKIHDTTNPYESLRRKRDGDSHIYDETVTEL